MIKFRSSIGNILLERVSRVENTVNTGDAVMQRFKIVSTFFKKNIGMEWTSKIQ
jgi:hypothetical protein